MLCAQRALTSARRTTSLHMCLAQLQAPPTSCPLQQVYTQVTLYTMVHKHGIATKEPAMSRWLSYALGLRGRGYFRLCRNVGLDVLMSCAMRRQSASAERDAGWFPAGHVL
jgi:hypothetical protein